jgi:RHS repeat-associated protein
MHRKLRLICLIVYSLVGTLAAWAQSPPSNKPTTQTQVGSADSVAPAPGSYLVGGQSPLVNRIRERDAMGRITDSTSFATAGYQDVKETNSYFDGLGRPLQTVIRQISPGNNPVDLVTPVVYDQFGREVYKYMPYIASSGNTQDGGFKLDPFTDQKNFYQNIYPSEQPAYTNEKVYYGQTLYESSPLNRVLQTMAPGNSWAGSGKGVSMQYLINTLADSIVIWNIGNSNLSYAGNDITTNIPTTSGYYPAGQLTKNVTVDEQHHAVVEYKDKDGLVILKKVQVGTVSTDFTGYSGWLSTYYVYDDLNQLRFVIPPKATTIAYGHSWTLSSDTTAINELCFRYEYDGRRRMIAKKVPGAGWVYMVYDQRDRQVYTQDANMRSRSQWMASLYDGLNRPDLTGMISFAYNRDSLENWVMANTGSSATSTTMVSGNTPGSLPADLDLTATTNGDERATTLIDLDNGFQTPDTVDFTAEIVNSGSGNNPFTNTVTVLDNPLPTGTNLIALTMAFYDDYSNTPEKQYATTYNSLLDAGSNLHAEDIPTASDQQNVQTRGLTTGTKVRVLENPADLTQGNWLATATFYDDRARVIQTQSDNYRGGQDTLTSRHNFTGQVISAYLAHANPTATANNNTRIKTDMNYDHANRLLQLYKIINDADSTKRLIVQHSYDQMGQLKQKQLGQLPSDGSFLETQDYSYNIRGWLKGINKDYANNVNNSRWFGLDLSYDWGFDSSQMNGNISGEKWRSKGDGQQRAYGFGYDPVNRLLYSDFNQYTGSAWNKSAGLDFSTMMGNGIDPSSAYDENGNIKAMLQSGWQLGGSHPIDSLNYTYYVSSNKLQNVIDGRNDPTTTLGDFRTSSLSPYNTGKTAAAIDYVYDSNGNMTRDLNKDIGSLTTDGITYNHLNLPYQISVRSATGTKGTITYIYDAAGNKLKKTTLDTAGNIQTVTTYIGAFQYQGRQSLSGGNPADTLQFFGLEEGRVRLATDTTGGQNTVSFKYDYFLKDHLGNTRMVLTDEQESDKYPAATMEVGDSSLENLYYSKLDSTRSSLPAGYPTDTTTNPNNLVAKVGGFTGPKTGPGIVLKVMAGDQFSIRVSSWYRLNGTTPGAPTNPLPDLLANLISGVGNLPGSAHPSPSQLLSNSTPLSTDINEFLSDTGSNINQGRPHAFVNWVLFDNQFNYVAASSGFDQVGTDQQLKVHTLLNLPVTSSGYLYIYTSNETPNVDVFFDNLQVTHTRGPLLEEDHYYPFGLTMAGISDKAVKNGYQENKYRYNGKRLNSEEFVDGSGTFWYDYGMREYDLQTGRFFRIDPISAKFPDLTPYQYASDDPIKNIDLDGLEGFNNVNTNNMDPYARILFHDDVQKDLQKFNNNAGQALQVTVSTGVGVGVKAKIGNKGIDLQANGPTASFTINSGGDLSAQGSVASVKASAGSDKLVSAEGTARLGVLQFQDGKVNFEPGSIDGQINGPNPSLSKSVSSEDGKMSEKGEVSSSAIEVALSAGPVGISVVADLYKAKLAAVAFAELVTDLFTASKEESSRHMHPQDNVQQ